MDFIDDDEPLVCPRCRIPGDDPRCTGDGAYRVTPEALRDAGRDAWLGEEIAGRYGIIQRLGVGGMGAVYKAIDVVAGRPVAIKFLREQYANHPSIRTRFIREAEAAAAVSSPYVVPLLDFGVEADGALWIVMEYVAGWTLRDEVNHHGAFGVADVVRLAGQVLAGLSAAHDAGLVHRDLKHDNIMFCGRRDHFIARILDFGVVKSAVADADRARGAGPLTAAGVLVGSPSYMSPEQIRGLEVGPPADLYALAVVMYEALTARRLFSVNNYEALLRAGARRDAPPLRHTGTGEVVPPALARILERALAHDPADRFPDARTMLLALEQMDAREASLPAELLADPPRRVRPHLERVPTPRPAAPSLLRPATPAPQLPAGNDDPLTAAPPWPAAAAFFGGSVVAWALTVFGLRLLS